MNKHYFSFHFDSSKKSWAQRMMSLALVVLFAISASVSFAQNESQRTKLVQGTVLDENGEPMRSVTVVPANDTGGTITDSKGVYILKCAETCDSLNFSFIGYKTLTIACKDAQTVRMQLEVLAAEDVVVFPKYVEIDNRIVLQEQISELYTQNELNLQKNILLKHSKSPPFAYLINIV